VPLQVIRDNRPIAAALDSDVVWELLNFGPSDILDSARLLPLMRCMKVRLLLASVRCSSLCSLVVSSPRCRRRRRFGFVCVLWSARRLLLCSQPWVTPQTHQLQPDMVQKSRVHKRNQTKVMQALLDTRQSRLSRFFEPLKRYDDSLSPSDGALLVACACDWCF
jgi:hypothetical protein